MNKSTNTDLKDRFRKEFIDELPERFRTIERLILALDWNKAPHDTLAELFRMIHGVRGSSSTFGLQILVAICHPFEELIQDTSPAGAVSNEFIDLTLSHLDLLRQNTEAIRQGGEDYDQTERRLADLHKRTFRRRLSIAVVVNSQTLREVCRQIGKSFNVRVIEFEDSLNALQRTLTEPFDVIIASSELYPMRGEALIAVLNFSYPHALGLKTILISANKEKAVHVNRETDADFVVLHNQDFVSNIQAIIAHILKQATNPENPNYE